MFWKLSAEVGLVWVCKEKGKERPCNLGQGLPSVPRKAGGSVQ